MAEKTNKYLTLLFAGVTFAASMLFAAPKISAAPQTMDKAGAQELMAQGNKYYQDREYEKAVDAYQEIINAGFESTSLYYNIGDAYYREGKLGYAILYYEKALRLSPGNSDVVYNLKIANARTVDKIESLPQFFLFEWWEALLAIFPVVGWTFVSYVFYILVLLSIALYFFSKSPGIQRTAVYGGFASIVFLILTVSLLSVKLNREASIKSAIVVEPTATVKLSPDPTSNDAFIIHEGLKVRELTTVGDWIEIRLRDGKEGWIEKNNIATI